MNIMVTGSAGMIGGYVVKGLIEKGHTVVGVDRRMSEAQYQGFNQLVLDLSSKDELMRLFDENKIDRAIHLAALAHTAGVKDTSWGAFKKINKDATIKVKGIKGKAKKKLVKAIRKQTNASVK